MRHQRGSAKHDCITPIPAEVWGEGSAVNPSKLPLSEVHASMGMDTKPFTTGENWCAHREAAPSSRRQEGTDDDLSGCNDIGNWKKCELLGRGAHGVVYRGILASTGDSVAVKQIYKNETRRSELQAAENEIRIIRHLRHPNVVRFLGVQEEGDALSIFLEYVDRGSLRSCLQAEGAMSEAQTADVTRKMLRGLRYLHLQGITHRDIKGANVLLSKDGDVKLADFGTSKHMSNDSVMSGLKGTPHWMAPEVIRGQQEPGGWFKADVWSVGCTVVEMLTGKIPWPDIPNPMAAMFQIAHGNPPPMDIEVSATATSFLEACCCSDPETRYSVEELLNHPFLRKQSDMLHRVMAQSSTRPAASDCSHINGSHRDQQAEGDPDTPSPLVLSSPRLHKSDPRHPMWTPTRERCELSPRPPLLETSIMFQAAGFDPSSCKRQSSARGVSVHDGSSGDGDSRDSGLRDASPTFMHAYSNERDSDTDIFCVRGENFVRRSRGFETFHRDDVDCHDIAQQRRRRRRSSCQAHETPGTPSGGGRQRQGGLSPRAPSGERPHKPGRGEGGIGGRDATANTASAEDAVLLSPRNREKNSSGSSRSIASAIANVNTNIGAPLPGQSQLQRTVCWSPAPVTRTLPRAPPSCGEGLVSPMGSRVAVATSPSSRRFSRCPPAGGKDMDGSGTRRHTERYRCGEEASTPEYRALDRSAWSSGSGFLEGTWTDGTEDCSVCPLDSQTQDTEELTESIYSGVMAPYWMSKSSTAESGRGHRVRHIESLIAVSPVSTIPQKLFSPDGGSNEQGSDIPDTSSSRFGSDCSGRRLGYRSLHPVLQAAREHVESGSGGLGQERAGAVADLNDPIYEAEDRCRWRSQSSSERLKREIPVVEDLRSSPGGAGSCDASQGAPEKSKVVERRDYRMAAW